MAFYAFFLLTQIMIFYEFSYFNNAFCAPCKIIYAHFCLLILMVLLSTAFQLILYFQYEFDIALIILVSNLPSLFHLLLEYQKKDVKALLVMAFSMVLIHTDIY